MITKIEQFKENFNFSIEKVRPTTKEELKDLIRETINQYGYNCDLNFIDTSEINDMSWLFNIWREFNGDISEWNVSNVIDMFKMFHSSKFKGDISKWDVSNVTDMNCMFANSKFNGDISGWDVSNVKYMNSMFYRSEFTGNIDDWSINSNCTTNNMFYNCKLGKQNKLPSWYKK